MIEMLVVTLGVDVSVLDLFTLGLDIEEKAYSIFPLNFVYFYDSFDQDDFFKKRK